jgi:plastocyanin
MQQTPTSRRSAVPYRHPLVAATVLIVVGVISGCGNSNGSSAAPATATPAPATASPPPAAGGSAPAAGGSTVEIKNFAFTPATLAVPVGASVTWNFDDSTDHTVTADNNSFASDAMGQGQTYKHSFDTAGTLTYHCSIHPFMKGSIDVK